MTWKYKPNKPCPPLSCLWSECFITATERKLGHWQSSMITKWDWLSWVFCIMHSLNVCAPLSGSGDSTNISLQISLIYCERHQTYNARNICSTHTRQNSPVCPDTTSFPINFLTMVQIYVPKIRVSSRIPYCRHSDFCCQLE